MRRTIATIVIVLTTLIVGGATTLLTFVNSERAVQIGAHSARVSPTFDSFATFDFGPLLPGARIPVEGTPFGVGVFIDVRDTRAADIEQLLMQDAVIAAQPQGEIDKIRGEVVSMLRDAALRGVGAALLTLLALAAVSRVVGRERWMAVERNARENRRRTAAYLAGGTVVAVLGSWLVSVPSSSPETPTYEADEWIALTAAFPAVPDDIEGISQVEVPANAATRAGSAIVEGLVKTYRTSLEFYGKLAVTAEQVVVRPPEKGEITALVVTDRHDNVGMDPVAGAIARRANASLVFDLGDDTSTGGSWEAFSFDSLMSTFSDFTVVAVAGNHDTGPFAIEALTERGATVLDGEPVNIEGIRLLGESDPRSSGLTAGYTGDEKDSINAIGEQDRRLTAAACGDGRIDTVLVHAQSAARELAGSGCARLILSGHLHRQVGPTKASETTVTLTTASTGGAVYAFALGSKLRRPAQVTVVTYRDGRSVGLQPVDISTGGEVIAQEYVSIDDLLAEDRP